MGRLSNSGDCFGVWLQYCVVVVLCTLVVLTDSVKSALYTNQLAVHIEGGPQEAHRIAKRHGFINLGQIGDLEDHYLFEHPHIVKRSTSISHEHHKKLNDESQVRWLEQQVVLSRKKRGFTEEKYTMNDPNWSDQWYLHRAKHLDMNVIPVWKKGYSGKGVVITILDDGIERNHADLVQNYDGQASYDINGRDADPMPRYDSTNENRHGTRCAGEVSASANNSVCGVGIAFESSIGGVRMLDGDVTDAVEAAALSLNPQHIDIYSASWGPDDDGRVVDGPGRLAKQSFINGITKGRNGLGSIFVWASGNGGNAHDSCNCDGYTNSIFTLSVSSTSESGSKPWYLEECSSTLATTYSSGGYREKQIVTTDLHNLCTKSHTGTSAAAPLAAGIVALVLEANPKLTWRDVQYITLLTARNDVFKDADWSVNSLGRKVSLKYGYGLMDSSAMVDLAETWTNVPQQHTCEKPADTSDVPLSGTPYSTTIVSDGCSSQANAIKYLEHVQINATLSYSRRGDISLKLTSPRGTTSTLLPKRQNDRNVGKFDNWPFMSVHFWGEDPTGTWTLEVRNEGVLSNHGMLSSWSLRLHGTATDPLSKSLTPHTDASPGTADLATTKPIITCHTECLDTCKGPNSQDCDSCKHYRVDNTGHCVENCSITYYTDQTNKTCYKCDSTCQTCDGPKSTQCGSCFGGWFLMTENNTCVMECAEGYFEEDPSGRCTSCDPSCLACQGSAKICTSCHDDKSLHDGVCLSSNECRGNEFKNQQGICEQCHIVCGTCTGPLLHDCLSCVSDDALTTYLQENTCVTQCGPEYYLSHPNDIQHPTCHRCHPSCKHCFGPTAADCGSCEDRLSLVNGKCVPSSPEPCPPGQYSVLGQCLDCHMSCLTCSGAEHTNCITCPPGSKYQSGECVSGCVIGTYPVYDKQQAGKVMSVCAACHETCASCHGATAADCVTCRPPLQVKEGLCVTAVCQESEYIDLDQSSCMPCHSSCHTCQGASPNDCLTCSFSYLFEGSCQSQCPERFYSSTDNTCLPCEDMCKTCKGPSISDCRVCMDGYQMVNGGCVMSCAFGQFFDTIKKSCVSCSPSCETCTGPLPTECASCSTPYVYHSQSHRCLSEQQSTPSVEGPRKEQVPQDDMSGFVWLMVALCALAVTIASLLFAILQCRSHNMLCWRHRYSKVPLTFDPLAEKLSMSSVMIGDDDDGDDQELFTNDTDRQTDPNHNTRIQSEQY